jgi:hypothetical protein
LSSIKHEDEWIPCILEPEGVIQRIPKKLA